MTNQLSKYYIFWEVNNTRHAVAQKQKNKNKKLYILTFCRVFWQYTSLKQAHFLTKKKMEPVLFCVKLNCIYLKPWSTIET